MVQTSAANGIPLDVFFDAVSAQSFVSGAENDLEVAASNEEEESSQLTMQFINEWLTAIADAVVGLVVSCVLEIKTLTIIGAAQLVTDIDYLRCVRACV